VGKTKKYYEGREIVSFGCIDSALTAGLLDG
jgi:hypothetical protein